MLLFILMGTAGVTAWTFLSVSMLRIHCPKKGDMVPTDTGGFLRTNSQPGEPHDTPWGVRELME